MRSAGVLVALGLALLAGAPHAGAATVEDTLGDFPEARDYRFTAATGEENSLEVRTLPDGDIEFHDSGAPLVAGEDCEAVDLHTAVCEGVDETAIRIYPEDEADFVDGSGVAPETAFRFWISDRGFGPESAPDHFIGMDMGSPPADERRSVLIHGAGGADRIELLGEMGLGADASNDFRSEATGGPGDDVILGSAGADFLLGESGEDEVTAGGGVDTASGETVRGNGGADSLFGTSSFGGRGADALHGGGRNDAPTSLHGGVGSDSFELHSHRYRKHQPLRNAPDDVFGGEGLDTATYEFCGRCEIRLDGEANDGSVEDGSVEGDNLRVENVAVYSRKDNPRFDAIYGPGDDRLVGDRADNRLFSSDGPDRVVGKGGSDKIATGDGADVILAADGEQDTVLCGKGADRVIADRADRIRDDCEDVVFR